ncbi:PAS domain S-box-containing protein/diguanylate cyclase (GGDEF)-like protein [Pseudoduganella lurida]|uniref:PAS domain S-box-containing protein/diguanylate cyclase (GGDEF)-like protein n=1 Tax=Pseudoduganella lurida TaxID=1036180 RepID=A0A562QVP8_9BURK|nr:EAL domain-containing protein [Pseudoduganella lurida]TWI60921.1 PAS domain S-box-containing protein/diguanylate cyclase (GGDEF)-like protein [Pseudoduganella lurida]
MSFNDIAHWRTQIFNPLLTIVVVLGTAVALPSIALTLAAGRWNIALVDAIAYAWLLGVWRARGLDYRTRVLHFLGILFFVGVAMMLSLGPISQVYLLAPPILAAVLLGKRPALAALALTGATILGLALSGHARLYVGQHGEQELLPTIVIVMNYLCIGLLLTLTSSALLQKLASSMQELRTFADSLEQGRNDLQAANGELRLAAAAVASLNDMVVIARAVHAPGAEQPISFVNDALLRRTGYAREDLIGQSMRMLHGPGTDAAEVQRLIDAMARGQTAKTEILNYTRSREAYWIEVEMVPFADEAGNYTHWVLVGRDVTERRRAADAIHRLAFYDVLTGLPNRRLLMDRLEGHLAKAAAGYSAVMFIDLDNFKFVNDARGHAVGDEMLRGAAGRLIQLVRPGDTVARVGGDEFVVLLADLGNVEEEATRKALAMAERLRAALTQDFEIGGQVYLSSASIGVAVLPRTGQTVDDLLREADIAMYRAKANGRNGVALFEDTMRREVENRLALERELAHALENGELQMHVQLQVDHEARPAGAELLMRWKRADGTQVPPDVFIPIAEATGLIIPLGRFALRQACLTWLRLAERGRALPLSVNVSPSQFRQPDFVAQVRAILEETGAPASQLIFEVTEGLLIENLDDTIARMHELAQLGIRFSIDDFGTGYSSLAYLRRMPLYELKIDRSFINDTPGDANGTAIVQSILAMAAHLGLRVVAEGVETHDQAAFLASHGGPGMQGYLFARPMPLGDMLALLERNTAVPALPA